MSQSTNSQSYNWDKYTCSDLPPGELDPGRVMSPAVTSSPRVVLTRAAEHHTFEDGSGSISYNNHSGVMTRSQSSRFATSKSPAAIIRSKRQRKLQHLLNDSSSFSVDTSTPDRLVWHKKMRLEELQASPVKCMEEDLILSINQMSIHDNSVLHNSVHNSLRDKSLVDHQSGEISSSYSGIKDSASTTSCSYRTAVSVNTDNSTTSCQHSLSIFSEDSQRTNSSYNISSRPDYNHLADLPEEEEEVEEPPSDNELESTSANKSHRLQLPTEISYNMPVSTTHHSVLLLNKYNFAKSVSEDPM